MGVFEGRLDCECVWCGVEFEFMVWVCCVYG